MKRSGRRRFVSLLSGLFALPLLPARAARADDLGPLIRKLTQGAPLGEGRVRLELPRLADNGHSVPLKVSVESPMSESEYVRRVTLLSERNPRPVMATFHFNPRCGRAQIATRVRLNGTQRVHAIAQLSDGSYWSASAEVEVTESACLDMT
ncbi:MAG TPA: thiosulfate oxidation carrier protein SoxY [Burkholderiales bacterium]|jgi:sulfur-oxidizing protein SoxY|nr:thiosulfate oxidation carrier protein SoxY [Burkholderiales bacterium]